MDQEKILDDEQKQGSGERLPLYYTFGNHMHWVDMEWLWGYQVLPDSVRDMIHFCNETGAKGNINFEGAGYEKMAVESPEALNELREAIQKGQIEVVGASYGQPYGLFHGSESNVRQRIYGVRAVMRVLGVRPRTFWEEEFDFFPQLPQMLKNVGFEYGSLFFQWTWHTPEVPRETVPAIWWEGMDGSRLLSAPRSVLNLHQWPEDFAGLLDSPLLREMRTPGIVQWLELMPSPDWMCRSELLLPQLKALMADPRFELRFATLSEYLDIAREHAEVRRYTLDDVFHGMSLGKNGDNFRRMSHQAEEQLLAAESISAMMGLFGRPYPHWDVYPTWELEEAWRELLSAQHHDNDECEGLCGHVGKYSYQRSLSISREVNNRARKLLADRIAFEGERVVAYNPLGWTRQISFRHYINDNDAVWMSCSVPPMGYTLTDPPPADAKELAIPVVEETPTIFTLRRGALSVTVDRQLGVITQITSADFPDGILRKDQPLIALEVMRNGELDPYHVAEVKLSKDKSSGEHDIEIELKDKDGESSWIVVSLHSLVDAIDISYKGYVNRPDPWLKAALQTRVAFNLPGTKLIHDHPYGVSEIQAQGKKYLRKYPTGEWMTSPQVFEEIHNPFTALSLLDFYDGERGVLYLHDGSQAFLREDDQGDMPVVRNILSMYDAWDEDYFDGSLKAKFRIIPHSKMDNATRWKLAQEFRNPPIVALSDKPGGDLPPTFGSVWCDADNVAVSAFYREQEISGAKLPNYAGKGMQFPYILRLVELNGETTTTTIKLPGEIAAAYKANALGEIEVKLEAKADDAPEGMGGSWSQIEISLRPYEIATLYLDLMMGRKMPRNLDAFRFVWATVHRVDNE